MTLSAVRLTLAAAGCVPAPLMGQAILDEVRAFTVEQVLPLRTIEPLGLVAAGKADGKGGLIILEATLPGLRFLDSLGHQYRTVGRSGDGPGEYRFPAGLGRQHDTLRILDGHRVSEVQTSGRHLRTIDVSLVLSHARRAYPGTTPEVLGVAADGGLVLSVRPQIEASAAPHRFPVLHWPLEAPVADTIGMRTLVRFGLEYAAAGRVFRMQQPLAANDFIALDPAGQTFVLVGPVGAPEQGIVRVSWRTLATGRASQYEYRADPQAITAAEWRVVLRRLIEGFVADPRNRDLGASAFDGLESVVFRPPYFPPISRIAAATDGTVWLRRAETAAASVDWIAVQGDGRIRGRLLLPRTARLLDSVDSIAWVLDYDEDGAPHLARLVIH